jgi:hypothetical protein
MQRVAEWNTDVRQMCARTREAGSVILDQSQRFDERLTNLERRLMQEQQPDASQVAGDPVGVVPQAAERHDLPRAVDTGNLPLPLCPARALFYVCVCVYVCVRAARAPLFYLRLFSLYVYWIRVHGASVRAQTRS